MPIFFLDLAEGRSLGVLQIDDQVDDALVCLGGVRRGAQHAVLRDIALVMKRLVPLTTYLSPFNSALQANDAASEPAPASVRA